MLSILIPIYNFDVTQLVQKLVSQCQKAKINYEVICFDDGSKDSFKIKNQPILHLMGVNYVELSENYGRSKIRNKLAKVAQYDHLVFLDCDSKIKYASFVKKYIQQIKDGEEIVYGGRYYKKSKPRAKGKLLHWTYGKKREALSLKQRLKKPYLGFLSNNFLISKSLFEEIRFDESIQGYGYEDLVFAEALKAKGIEIHHIENPVEHIDLIKAEDFISKTEVATENLKNLIKQGKITETRLTKVAHWIQRLGLTNLLIRRFEHKEKIILENLKSTTPNLRNLDFLKLYLFLKED